MLSAARLVAPRALSRIAPVGWAELRGFADHRPASDQGTHDDFKPKYKTPSVEPDNVEELIAHDVKGNSVFIYMKGDPAAPMCGFSNMACRILDAYGVQYGSRNVLADPEVREGIKKYTSWPTIPQVFVDGEFVGGADILMSMHQSGELEKMLKSEK